MKPIDVKLYQEVKEEAKQRFSVWPSAYASGWLVKTYKARGGRYEDVGNDDKKDTIDKRPLNRWYREHWVNVCTYLENGKLTTCGRAHATTVNYPYCRPSVRVSDKTPTTLYELINQRGKQELRKRCAIKRSDPMTRVK